MKNRLVRLLTLLFGLLLIVNLVRSVISVSQKSRIIGDTEKQLQQAKEKNNSLKRNLAQVSSPEYIEKEARDKLNLGRAGEYVVILPPISPEVTPTPLAPIPHWEAWVRVFWP